MADVQSSSHTKWECKYHVVWIPKYRRKTLYGELRRHLGSTFRDLAVQKECQVMEGHLLPDPIHMIFGRAGILCQPLERMRRRSASISGKRSRKIVASTA